LFGSPSTERSVVMKPEKYIGMDVHQATISVAVLDDRGKLIMECILETKAATMVEFLTSDFCFARCKLGVLVAAGAAT
jgi:hypothetical protein